LRAAQRLNPALPVIVRTVDDSEIDNLMKAGAAEVVPELLEGSLMLASQAMLTIGTPLNRVLKRIRAVREERYNLFQGFFHGASDTPETDAAALRMHAVVLNDHTQCLGRNPAEIELPKGVSIHSVRRSGAVVMHDNDSFTFQSGDRVVLLGTMVGIGRAQERLQ
jgi:monovalent cation:H+ antiporter-2, CPA2 family